jgi:hypothetical protein
MHYASSSTPQAELLHREPGGGAVNNRHDDRAVTCHRSWAECRLAGFHAGSWTG